jgi:rRNA maturation endonuclease Nob1
MQNIDSDTLRRNARAAVKAAKKEQAKAIASDDNSVENCKIAMGVNVVAAEADLERVEAIIAARGKASRRAYASAAYANGYARNF